MAPGFLEFGGAVAVSSDCGVAVLHTLSPAAFGKPFTPSVRLLGRQLTRFAFQAQGPQAICPALRAQGKGTSAFH